VPQLFGEDGRPEGFVTADVHSSQKNYKCHTCPRAGVLRKISPVRSPD
jgi:hypothetical protein